MTSTLGLEPEDGLIWVYGIEHNGILAFTDEGIQELRLLIDEFNRIDPTK